MKVIRSMSRKYVFTENIDSWNISGWDRGSTGSIQSDIVVRWKKELDEVNLRKFMVQVCLMQLKGFYVMLHAKFKQAQRPPKWETY